MPRSIWLPLVGVVLVGGLVLFLFTGDTEEEDAPEGTAVPLMVYFTCDTHGRLEPCGCFTGQLGGLTRVHTWLGNYRISNNLLVDVGGAIAGSQDFHVIQYEYILKAYEEMGYHALNIGAAEAALTASELEELNSKSTVPLLSASLIHRESRKPIFRPSTIIEIGDRKVGLLGVVDPQSVDTPGDDVEILPIDTAINTHLPDLVGKCDTLVLLAFAPESELRRIAREFYEFPLILGGDVRQSSQEILRENDSTVLFTTNHARTVGQVRLTGTDHKPDAFDIHLMYPDIPQSTLIADLSAEFRKTVRKTELAIDDPSAPNANAVPGVTPVASYVGSDSCRTCHAQEHAIWKASGHGHAFQTLKRQDSDADPTCIGCHTVGFGTPSGYRRSFLGEKLVDVGCESCHGPGSEHVRIRQDGRTPPFKFRSLGAGDCKSCHHGEFSRPFDWDKFWPRIRHGKGQLPDR